MTSKSLQHMMPDAWPIFFRRRRPRPVQEEAMPRIVRGDSVLISGPTASGKTEAAVAPLYQRHVSFGRNKVSVVYIAPTKALVNDLYYRLHTYLGIKTEGFIHRYTGDHHDFKSPEGSFLLLATPEALDSLQLTKPEILTSVRAVVVDEIHMLHGTSRGQQLRHVIKRMEFASAIPANPKDVFQKIGMTATIQDMKFVCNKWLGNTAYSMHVGEQREIEMVYLHVPARNYSEKPSISVEIIAQWLESTIPQKILIFGNTRNATHVLAAGLYERLVNSRWQVHWHTGILSKVERERVEEAMRGDRHGICVATSTLEVGIDIGDIDVIILLDPPYSINGFLQRIGRGNRKSETCRVVALYVSDQERVLYRALGHCAKDGILDDVHDFDRPSVRFQQILSYAWRGISRDKTPLTLKNLSERTGSKSHKKVVHDMLSSGVLKEVGTALIPSDEFMDMGEKRQIHSTISGGQNLQMVDSLTGDGLISTSSNNVTMGEMFVGGKIKQTVEHADGTVSLSPLKIRRIGLSSLPASRGRRGLGRRIVWALAKSAGHDPRHWQFSGTRLTTWGGCDYNRLLAIILWHVGKAKSISSDDYGVNGLNYTDLLVPRQVKKWARDMETSRLISYKESVQFCERNKYFKYLGSEMQKKEAFNAIPFDGFIKWLNDCDENK